MSAVHSSSYASSNSYIFHALQTSHVLHILMNARWRINQLLNRSIHTIFVLW